MVTAASLIRRCEDAIVRFEAVIAACADAPPQPHPLLCAPHLPSRTAPQRGSNCRQVALTNVLRLGKELSLADLQPFMQRFLREQFPKEAAKVAAGASVGVQWTLGGQACTCLMTLFIESHFRGVAIMGTPFQRPALERLFGNKLSLADHLLADRAAPGCIYFTRAHCMSVLQDPGGRWWDVPQSTMTQLPPACVGQLRQKLRSHEGFVLLFSVDYCRRVLAPALLDHLNVDPLLAARIARRALPLTHPILRAAPHHLAACREAMATPTPRWSTALFHQVHEAAMAWLLAVVSE